MASPDEVAAMRRALALSVAALGSTNPNPSVGAVVIDAGGHVVGEGSTAAAGGEHAEVRALRAAGEAARGSTLIVTLEPCNHCGRTPPCTDAIVAAGVARVGYALADPHPIAQGGAGRLIRAGVDVEAGILADDVEVVLGAWICAAGRGRPFATWKYAATLDGHTSAADGTSRWITGAEARRDVHRERLHSDAVVVGIGTVLADDPALTVRAVPAPRQPVRVVIDSSARTPVTARVLDGSADTLIVVGDPADSDRVADLRRAGAEVVRLPGPDGRVDLSSFATQLFQRGCYLVLVEGGATLAAALVRAGLIDRVVGYHAPALLGGGSPVLGDLGIATISDALRFRLDDVSRVGEDVRVIARTGSAGR